MAEPAKYFSNVILSQYVMTGIPVDVQVDGKYLRLTDVEDVEDPYYGFGMDADGGMHEFDYRMIDHILVNGNNITLDTYNKGMGLASKEETPAEEEKPEGEEETKKEESTMKLKSLIEKSVSKQQQKLFGTALSVKRGDTPASKVGKDVKTLAKSMPEKELEKFAGTKHKGLPKKVTEDLESDKKKLQKLKLQKADQAEDIAALTLKIADQEAKAARAGVTSESSEPITSVSEPYTIQVGDLVQNINTACPHYGSMGIVQKLISLPDDMGTLVKYTVTNSGDNYSAGDSLIKTTDQLTLAGAEDEIDMNDYSDEYDDYDVVDYDFGDADDYEYYDDEDDTDEDND